ncbi:hypothetical protein AN958_04337 [Leucoagaricus sp. SymC.cos]|nr:hypothetical protein AN958_04337 [Leucoagaricus sp. SymC.cos]
MSTSRRAKSLLVFFAFFIDQVACKGGKGGGIKGKGSDIGESVGSSLNLPPELTAVFAITIVVAVFTFYQIGRAASRLKKSVLPEGSPTLPYDVGKLFPWMLFAYLGVYLLWTILYAVYIAVEQGASLGGLAIGMRFVAQVSDVLFFGMLLAIVAYRLRIQLNPSEPLFNLKSFLDGWLLTVILILGIGRDVLAGTLASGTLIDVRSISNFDVAYEVFDFLGCLNVIGTSIMAHLRLKKSEIADNIVKIAAFFVTPFIFIRGLYRLIEIGIFNTVPPPPVDPAALIIARAVIDGIASIVIVGLCLLMGAPPKPSKGDKNKNVTYEPVKA